MTVKLKKKRKMIKIQRRNLKKNQKRKEKKKLKKVNKLWRQMVVMKTLSNLVEISYLLDG